MSKNFPKNFQKFSKKFTKISKKIYKNFQKTFQKFPKKFSKISQKILKNFQKNFKTFTKNGLCILKFWQKKVWNWQVHWPWPIFFVWINRFHFLFFFPVQISKGPPIFKKTFHKKKSVMWQICCIFSLLRKSGVPQNRPFIFELFIYLLLIG